MKKNQSNLLKLQDTIFILQGKNKIAPKDYKLTTELSPRSPLDLDCTMILSQPKNFFP